RTGCFSSGTHAATARSDRIVAHPGRHLTGNLQRAEKNDPGLGTRDSRRIQRPGRTLVPLIDGLRCAGSVPLGTARRRGVTADTRRVVVAGSPRAGRAARTRLPGTQLRPTRLNPV